MTVDKIKHYMSSDIYNFWSNCEDIEVAERAFKMLKYELDNGILENKIEYQAELNLLKMKLGI